MFSQKSVKYAKKFKSNIVKQANNAKWQRSYQKFEGHAV